MKTQCPYCSIKSSKSDPRLLVKKSGVYRRKSDCRRVQKFRCLSCLKYFSNATKHPCLNQNKRQFNQRLFRLLCSGVSQRRAAKLLKLSRTTIARKLVFLGYQAQLKLEESNRQLPKVAILEFDDLETFEHTKYKPLSVTLAVESRTRRILGFQVSQMPAKGLLVKTALKKYGPRMDERSIGRQSLFTDLKGLICENAIIKSDENPHYVNDVKSNFPMATHQRFKGMRGSIVGQGELKKVRFDPLFSLNHTCAMYRANVNRLFRKTWCTTKNRDRLTAHLAMYAVFHNFHLLNPS